MMQDLGLCGVESYRGKRHRYQAPLNVLIFKSPFGNYERVTVTTTRPLRLRLSTHS